MIIEIQNAKDKMQNYNLKFKAKIAKTAKNHHGGFSLIELITALVVTGMILTLASAIFVEVLRLYRRASAMQKVQENAAYILESMAKEIRDSQVLSPDSSCPAFPANTLSLDHPAQGSVQYTLLSGNLNKNGYAVNSSDTLISKIDFCISGTTLGDSRQTRVTIVLSATAAVGGENVSFDTQTTVSQRFLNN